MARSTIHISVPDAVRRYVEDRVKTAGYGSVSEYFRELLRDDRQKQLNRMNRANAYERQPEPQYRPLASAARRPR